MAGIKCRKCGKVFATHRSQMQHHKAKHQDAGADMEEALARDALSEMYDEDYDALYWRGLEDAGDG